MKTPKNLRSHSIIGGLALALALTTAAPSAHANVYASNVKINGGMTNISVAQGASVTISYILNEPASSGVTIKLLSGATVLRTISIAGGAAGTLRGLNTVTWDGKADGGANMPGGNYSVSITAASAGYAGWSKITDDNNIGNFSWESRGIAVDRNTNSPYYGRVFVGNSYAGPGSSLGDQIGIQKLNADGSYADEGGFSTGGVAWYGAYWSPWKIRVSDDDYVYVEDFYNYGDIYRFDGAISTNSMLYVFAAPLDGTLGNWSGFCLVGQGTNTVLWASDATYPGSLGICKFLVQSNGTFEVTNGIPVVGAGGGGSPGMSLYPYSVALDKAGNIYTLQYRVNQYDSEALVFRFPAYDPSTNSGLPEYTGDWSLGPGDDYGGGKGIAVDPTGAYVAASFWGYNDGTTWNSGNIKILNTADGTIVTNLDLGVSYPSSLTSDPTHHMDTDCDWDAVGNLYYLDDWPGCWRAFSPPGANSASTLALAKVQVKASVTPTTIRIVPIGAGYYTIAYSGGGGSQFVLLTSPTVNAPLSGWTRAATNTAPGGTFLVTPNSHTFYRVKSE
jgi:hypothetical protein